MREGPKTRRSGPLPAGAVLLAVIALALPSWAPASEERGGGARASAPASSVRVKLLSAGQQEILSRGRLRARISTGAAGVVKLKAKARSATGEPAGRIGKTRRLRFGEKGSRRIGLRLNARGRALLARCEGLTLVLRGRLRTNEASAAARTRAISSRPLSVDAPFCGSAGSPPAAGGGTPNGNLIPPPTPWNGAAFPTGDFTRCDFLDGAICLQPWPNDYFTAPDGASDTESRLNLHPLSMPRNTANKPIDNSEFNRNDGFSPGNMLVTRVPGLDNPQAFENTGAVPIDDPGAYDDPGQPVVVINAETGERHPVWAEIDSNPIDPVEGGDPNDSTDRAKVNLIIRPLVNFEEEGRYVVALRSLKNAANETIQPADAFRVYRDNLITDQPLVEGRRPQMEELFEILGQAGIQRSSLYLAWDFSIASERNLSERMLSIRDDAFGQLGDSDLGNGAVEGSAPAFTIDTANIETFEPCSAGTGPQCEGGEDDRIARIVPGTVTVPCYLNNASCAPAGGTFNYSPADLADPDRLPTQTPGNTASAAFECLVPRAAAAGLAPPSRPSLYGHGLLGSHTEVEGGNIRNMAGEHNFVLCATDWAGFSTLNAGNILAILQDLSLFPLLADHSQQGFLNMLYLGRLMIHEDGLVTDPAFQGPDGDDPDPDPDALINREELFYDGNSQGGILGGGLTAVAPDFRQAVLGVPGMNYSTLLRRSVDFEPYAKGQFTEIVCDELPDPFKTLCNNEILADSPFGLYDNYPNELERPLILSLMQTLWDRAEANGYAHHMTDDPLENTPSHNVLLHTAFGDHQVANVTAEVEARTIGASVYQPALDPGRHWEADGSAVIFDIPAVPSFPFGGSALVYWDGGPLGFDDPFDGDAENDGTATPPNENIPPRPPAYGADPHSYPRNDVKGRAQKGAFLAVNGRLRNPCTTTNNFVNPPLPIALDTGTAIPCYANGYLGP